MNGKKDAVVACNGSGFCYEGWWEPSATDVRRLTNVEWNMVPSGNLIITNGKVLRTLKDTKGANLKTSGQVGILPNGSLKFYYGTTYETAINDGVQNTFTFSSFYLIQDGKKNANIRNYKVENRPRTCVGQIDSNNYVLLTCHSEFGGVSIEQMANLGLALKCDKLYNFDGGGSSTLWIKNLTYEVSDLRAIARPVADSLYFTTTNGYNKSNGTYYGTKDEIETYETMYEAAITVDPTMQVYYQ